ncbi:hypothetical protein [Streptomyces phaeoluteigriseus]|uniref:hypothetical protein n=1 Tax=Streptomyces phaeoluteigriseus TaxID=114686 RepID=UPI001301B9A3|nr:hypothetical protein [Streptomyces phaeoluteigriseus]
MPATASAPAPVPAQAEAEAEAEKSAPLADATRRSSPYSPPCGESTPGLPSSGRKPRDWPWPSPSGSRTGIDAIQIAKLLTAGLPDRFLARPASILA